MEIQEKVQKSGDDLNGYSPQVKPSPTKLGYKPHRHLWILSFSFFFIFSAYGCLEHLQSSLNTKAGVGLQSLVVLYGSAIFSGFIAAPIIQILTVKRALLLGWSTHVLYVASNFYPVPWTLLPAACLLGIATSVIWTCQGLYVSRFAHEMAKNTGESSVATLSRFNGYFVMLMSLAPFGGHLSSAILFSISKTTTGPSSNFTTLPTENNISSLTYHHLGSFANTSSENATFLSQQNKCGASFCVRDSYTRQSSNSADIPFHIRYILIGLFLVFDALGIILTCTLTNIPKQRATTQQSRAQKCCGGLNILRNVRFLLILPGYILYCSVRAVMGGMYTKGFITCSSSIRFVSFAMLLSGVMMIIGSTFSGHLGKYVHRSWHLAIAFAVELAFCVLTLFWDPSSTHVAMLFIPPALVAIGTSVFSTQLDALMGLLFEGKKEAFSMKCVVKGIGHCSAYVMCTFLCYKIIIYILLVYWFVAASAYIALALILRKEEDTKPRAKEKEIGLHGECEDTPMKGGS